jgi:hypothetical protein
LMSPMLAESDKAADRLQSGIREVKQGVSSSASAASNKVEAMRNATGPALDKASDAAQGNTRQKPIKALLISAAAGAALITLVRAFSSSSRDS